MPPSPDYDEGLDYTKCALYNHYFNKWEDKIDWEEWPETSTWSPTWSPTGDWNNTEPWTSDPWETTAPDWTPAGTCDGKDGRPFDPAPQKIQHGLTCNRDNGKIVGGTVVGENNPDIRHTGYPWQVRLTMWAGNDGYQCGGSIIDDEWIVSAAHCCVDVDSIDVAVGDWDAWGQDAGEFTVTATDIITHPDYGTNGHSNDICLLRVPSLAANKPSSETTYGTICLPAEDYEHAENCFVSGWGTTSSNGSVSQFLQEVGVNLFDHDYCNNRCHVSGDMIGATHGDKEICGGTGNPDGMTVAGKDSCQGDSGGPLTCVRNGVPELAGVVSWGYGCAAEGNPGVYANTFHYNDWIKNTINDAPVVTTTPDWNTAHTTHPTTNPTSNQPTMAPNAFTTVEGCPAPEDDEFQPVSQQIQKGLRCDNSNINKIVGGNAVASTEYYPWQVRITLNDMYQCGGSIIDDEWIVTAAHCCAGINKAEVYIGDLDMFSNNQGGEFSLVASDIIKHESYPDPANGIANDICLLKVPSIAAEASTTGCNDCYSSICLPTHDFDHGEACFVSGWGTTAAGGSVSRHLLQVGVSLMDFEYCTNPCHVTSSMVHGVVDEKEICATIHNPDGGQTLPGKDACQGDSGGPLTCVRNNKPVLAGVVSWGFGCAGEGNPGVYANTHYYLDWIAETMENN